MNFHDPGSMKDRPEAIDGELQLEELEFLTDRQAENFVGGFSFTNTFKLVLRRSVPGFPTSFPVLNLTDFNLGYVPTAPS